MLEMTPSSTPPTHVLTIEGMMCQQSCGSTVANALRNVPGVSRAEASFADHNASVWGDVDVALLIDAVECVGFGAEVSQTKPAPPSSVSLKSSREFRVNGMRTLTDARRVEQAALKAGCGSVDNTCYRHYTNTAACVMPPEGVRRTAAVARGGPNSPVQS